MFRKLQPNPKSSFIVEITCSKKELTYWFLEGNKLNGGTFLEVRNLSFVLLEIETKCAKEL